MKKFRMEVWLEGNCITEEDGFENEEEAEIEFRETCQLLLDEWESNGSDCKDFYTVDDFEFELYEYEEEDVF